MKSLFVFYIMVLVVSCASPFPKQSEVFVTGTVYKNDNPLPKVKLYLINEDDGSCKNAMVETESDENGNFALSVMIERKYAKLLWIVIDERIYPLNLCAEINGNWSNIWSAHGDTGAKSLICEIRESSGECWHANMYQHIRKN